MNPLPTRVAVIGGGQNCEHEVSLASAAAVAAALDPARYEVVRLTIGRDGAWSDEHGGVVGLGAAVELLQTCAAVLPVVHGPRGEDGTLAALCDLAGVPCVGSGVRAGALAMDKWATKLVAEAIGVRTATGVLVSRADSIAWSGPVVVKPVAAGSSHGVSLVRDADDFADALESALALDDRVLVEEVIVGREIDLAVLRLPGGDLMVAPALEIVVDDVFDTRTKYDGSADFRLPADLDEVAGKDLETAAIAMYEALGCAGVARIDFFVTEHGPVLNEVNTMPGMTEQSQVPKMFAAGGLPYPDLLDLLVRGAL
ncbi:D-alanine--D-alanine ligase family protein [Nocardioides sp.]|uniref:D-alanine--D-alanine ligase family protein n=1 Tax=Nocardioides sp. TaxID=35761 RepID=UPI003D105691